MPGRTRRARFGSYTRVLMGPALPRLCRRSLRRPNRLRLPGLQGSRRFLLRSRRQENRARRQPSRLRTRPALHRVRFGLHLLLSSPEPRPVISTASDPERVDINAASAEDLNRLGGRFAKAIIASRPYGSVDDLMSKRVLTRSTFSQIKDRISCLRPPEGGS